jgi:hypothetical protein
VPRRTSLRLCPSSDTQRSNARVFERSPATSPIADSGRPASALGGRILLWRMTLPAGAGQA